VCWGTRGGVGELTKGVLCRGMQWGMLPHVQARPGHQQLQRQARPQLLQQLPLTLTLTRTHMSHLSCALSGLLLHDLQARRFPEGSDIKLFSATATAAAASHTHAHVYLLLWLRTCCAHMPQARRFPEGSDIKLFYEVGIQNLFICFTIVVLISGGVAGLVHGFMRSCLHMCAVHACMHSCVTVKACGASLGCAT
jgi:hypothetical protein